MCVEVPHLYGLVDWVEQKIVHPIADLWHQRGNEGRAQTAQRPRYSGLWQGFLSYKAIGIANIWRLGNCGETLRTALITNGVSWLIEMPWW